MSKSVKKIKIQIKKNIILYKLTINTTGDYDLFELYTRNIYSIKL